MQVGILGMKPFEILMHSMRIFKCCFIYNTFNIIFINAKKPHETCATHSMQLSRKVNVLLIFVKDLTLVIMTSTMLL